MLTNAQKEYFKDSKIRDKNGQLVVCMHRTNHEFDAFDKDKITDDSYCGRGFYFTSRTDFGKCFGGKTLECYLNIEKPLILDQLDSYTKYDLLDHFGKSEVYQQGETPRIEGYPQKSEEYMVYRLIDSLEYHAWDDDTKALIDEVMQSSAYESFVESGNIEDLDNAYGWSELKRNDEFQEIASQQGFEDLLNLEPLTVHDLNYQKFHYGYWNDFASLLTDYAQQNGYDGILLDLHQGRSTEIVVFEPNQIKLTTNLCPTNSDLLYEEAPQEELSLKDIQMEIIQQFNPMLDDYHTGIRSVDDIKTFEEAMQDDESFVYGDFDYEDAQKALETGKVTVYSSKPIEQGGFVSTSYNMAKDYAGAGKVYSKVVSLEDVAWINGDEGQYANVQEYAMSKPQSLDDLIAAAGEPTASTDTYSRNREDDAR